MDLILGQLSTNGLIQLSLNKIGRKKSVRPKINSTTNINAQDSLIGQVSHSSPVFIQRCTHVMAELRMAGTTRLTGFKTPLFLFP